MTSSYILQIFLQVSVQNQKSTTDHGKSAVRRKGHKDELDVTMAQRTELDYLIYNDPLGYADLILNGDPEEY